ncbi:DUF983 domain-containing protein [Acuticoccus sp. 2012]|uniref:DUF983 domain-containing protein n=2 Tax=Acuticoccus mangrovi TaxID=2796142 RepID=A0A934IS23_9HYPH|nr:DUF983 domain-containing protein [Acuticoccus mangrovi]
MTIDRADYPSPITIGLTCRCPRCGKGKLFKGFLSLRESCDVCGLDYDFADPADGPAFFVLCFTCVPALIVAVWVEVALQPPLWVHFLTTLPLIIAACVLPLRPLKAWLIASQFYHDAAEGKRVDMVPPAGQTSHD